MTDIQNNSSFDYDRYYGKVVIDSAGDKVGDVGQVYLDDATGRPEWVTVRTGLFGTKETFVPLQNEDFKGDELHVPYTKDQIKGAPSIDPNGHISEAEEDELYRYYGNAGQGFADRRTDDYNRRAEGVAVTGGVAGTGVGADRTHYADSERTDVARENVARTDVARDDKLADGDVVRREERLNVGTERQEAGRVHIRKHVVTEQQSVSVPVSHEELRVERTPIADGQATGERLSEGETEVVLHEERPVVSKETVGVERISVGKEQVTENQTVTENVAKEQVEVVQDGRDRVADGTRGTDRLEGDRTVTGDHRSFGDKVKDKLDRDHDGHIG